MEGLSHNTQKSEPAPASSAVGTLLCATRMRLGQDLQHIAEMLHIRYNYLVAMEDGRYEDLPGRAYAIGFVRAYADYLGLDGGEIVRRYKEESSGLKNRPVFEFPMSTPDSGVPSGGLILAAVLFGMVVYGVWYAFAGSDRSAVQAIQEVPDRLSAMLAPSKPAETPAENAAAPAEVMAEADTAPEPDDGDTSQAPPLPGAPTVTPPQIASVPAASVAPPSTDIVELRAKSDVWITLRNAENLERTQMLHKGEVFRAPEGGGGMALVTAAPTDLEILVNGEAMPPLDSGVFAKGVPLDPQRLKGSPPPASPGSN